MGPGEDEPEQDDDGEDGVVEEAAAFPEAGGFAWSGGWWGGLVRFGVGHRRFVGLTRGLVFVGGVRALPSSRCARRDGRMRPSPHFSRHIQLHIH